MNTPALVLGRAARFALRVGHDDFVRFAGCVREEPAPPGVAGVCWIWRRALDRYGYGKFTVGRRVRKAHRWAWAALRGPLKSSQVLDHICRRRACCNPEHLEPITSRQNTLRGLAARRAAGTLPLPFPEVA